MVTLIKMLVAVVKVLVSITKIGMLGELLSQLEGMLPDEA